MNYIYLPARIEIPWCLRQICEVFYLTDIKDIKVALRKGY